PSHSLLERRARDVFDTFHQFDEPFALAWSNGCEPDSAIAPDDGRDAVTTRRREVGVPRDLAVVVRVDVDEARCHEMTRGVDDFIRLRMPHRTLVVDTRYEPVAHRDVGVAPFTAATVDQCRVPDHQVEVGRGHGRLPWRYLAGGRVRLCRCGSGRRSRIRSARPSLWLRRRCGCAS